MTLMIRINLTITNNILKSNHPKLNTSIIQNLEICFMDICKIKQNAKN